MTYPVALVQSEHRMYTGLFDVASVGCLTIRGKVRNCKGDYSKIPLYVANLSLVRNRCTNVQYPRRAQISNFATYSSTSDNGLSL